MYKDTHTNAATTITFLHVTHGLGLGLIMKLQSMTYIYTRTCIRIFLVENNFFAVLNFCVLRLSSRVLSNGV